MRIVVLGSARFSPYDIILTPSMIPKLHNTEEGYKIASEKFHPAIDEADEVWIYAPDGLGEHTSRDLAYAKTKGKIIRLLRARE